MPSPDDQTFLNRFENCQLTASDFNHQGHLRVAWLYLMQFNLDEAISHTCQGIQRLATHLGAPEKFNHTVTEALVRIMAHRMKHKPTTRFTDFLAGNNDLLVNARGVLTRYYSEEVLMSREARRRWVEPDRFAIG